jgi:tetratricopeptide (TPR) repeat protein
VVIIILCSIALSGIVTSTVIESQKDRKDRYIFRCLPVTPDPDVRRLFEEGVKLYAKCKFKDAITTFNNCLLLPSATIENKTALHNLIGMCYYSLSDYKSAKAYYEKSLEIAKKIKDKTERLKANASAYNNIGGIYYAQGNYQQALMWYEKSKDILEKIGDMHHLAMSLRIALLYRDTHKKAKARQYLNESYKIRCRKSKPAT